MATYKELITGLEIFQRHDGDEHIGGAGHDVIYASMVDPDELTKDELEALEAAGWSWSDQEGWKHFA